MSVPVLLFLSLLSTYTHIYMCVCVCMCVYTHTHTYPRLILKKQNPLVALQLVLKEEYFVLASLPVHACFGSLPFQVHFRAFTFIYCASTQLTQSFSLLLVRMPILLSVQLPFKKKYVPLCDPMDCSPPCSAVHGILHGQSGLNTGVACRFFLQGIFPTQGSNPSLLHFRQILYHLSPQGSPFKICY